MRASVRRVKVKYIDPTRISISAYRRPRLWLQPTGYAATATVRPLSFPKGRGSDLQAFPIQWAMGRIFGCLGRHRRLYKDCELLPENRERMIGLQRSN